MCSAVVVRVRLTAQRCRAWACCGAWGFHVWVCGPSGVLLGCERGRAGSTLASFFEGATMNACGAAHQGRILAPLRVLLGERTVWRHVESGRQCDGRHGNREGR